MVTSGSCIAYTAFWQTPLLFLSWPQAALYIPLPQSELVTHPPRFEGEGKVKLQRTRGTETVSLATTPCKGGQEGETQPRPETVPVVENWGALRPLAGTSLEVTSLR